MGIIHFDVANAKSMLFFLTSHLLVIVRILVLVRQIFLFSTNYATTRWMQMSSDVRSPRVNEETRAYESQPKHKQRVTSINDYVPNLTWRDIHVFT
jgi:hypothetical protein